MFTMTFPPIADNTVTSAPCTKPRFAKNLLVSSLPPILCIVHVSPIPTIIKGMISSPFSLFYHC